VFERTSTKMEDARCCLRALERATTQMDFKANFLAFISAARAVTLAMQKDGAHVPGFKDWYGPEQAALKGDAVMKYVNSARTADFHLGENDLLFQRLAIHEVQVWEHPPVPGAELQITSLGPAWVVQDEDGHQTRYPADVSVTGKMTVSLRGAPIEDPVELCRVALEYCEQLTSRLHAQFGRQ